MNIQSINNINFKINNSNNNKIYKNNSQTSQLNFGFKFNFFKPKTQDILDLSKVANTTDLISNVDLDASKIEDDTKNGPVYINAFGEELPSCTFSENANRLFYQENGIYYPFNNIVDDYKDNKLLSSTLYSDGFKSVTNEYYDNGRIKKTLYYSNPWTAGERGSVCKVTKFSKDEACLTLQRNQGSFWNESPEISLCREFSNRTDIVDTLMPSKDGEVGYFICNTLHPFVDDDSKTMLVINSDGTFEDDFESSSQAIYMMSGLGFLKETLENDEFSPYFNTSEKFNTVLDNAIGYLKDRIENFGDEE